MGHEVEWADPQNDDFGTRLRERTTIINQIIKQLNRWEES